ncbi:hypothetical protein R3P38DRAFT_2659822 [Favolaschia claudopus]|uniref:BTB domain-containing protein n=1 Tax=Favolaschia claudopus TaxID=2862362 RepID=A0AAV9ZS85_9AGAR
MTSNIAEIPSIVAKMEPVDEARVLTSQTDLKNSGDVSTDCERALSSKAGEESLNAISLPVARGETGPAVPSEDSTGTNTDPQQNADATIATSDSTESNPTPQIQADHNQVVPVSRPESDHGDDTTVGSQPPSPRIAFSSIFPQLSPPLEPVKTRVIDDIPPISEDEDDLPLPTLQNMIADTRPDYGSQKRSQEKSSSRLSQPIKQEKVSTSQPHGTPPRSRSHSFIDLTDSPPSTKARSPSLPAQTPTKRKYTPTSVPPDLSSPPAKRSKTAFTANLPAHKHAVHWALDGSIVIQIQDTKFRLHQSHLAKHSPWFAGLVNGERVAGGEYVERGDEDGSMPIYILNLPGLSAKDFARLLDTIDLAITYANRDPSFGRITAILRVSTILSFNDYRDWAVRFLEDQWSPDLAELSRARLPHATEIVVLARACDVPSLLKRALYELVRMAGYGQNDVNDGDDRDPAHTISTHDLRTLVKAREQLAAVWTQTTSPFSSPDFMVCASSQLPIPAAPVPCVVTDGFAFNKAYHKLVYEPHMMEEYLYDPVCGLKALMDADWEGEGFCEACVRLRREVWGKKREKVWENLDIWFGLG